MSKEKGDLFGENVPPARKTRRGREIIGQKKKVRDGSGGY